jgi:hypothetical protein
MNKNDEEPSNNETMDEVDTVGFYMCPDGQATDHYRLVEDHLPTISSIFQRFSCTISMYMYIYSPFVPLLPSEKLCLSGTFDA